MTKTCRSAQDGRKRHIVTDTIGNILNVNVGFAGESDHEGAKDLLEKLKKGWNKGQFLTLYADGGYRGNVFKGWISEKLHWRIKRYKAKEWNWGNIKRQSYRGRI
ncbi:MAG: transposase [Deinococcaceae bacterium]